MRELYAQGDVLIERVDEQDVAGIPFVPIEDGSFVLAEGEATGHRHLLQGNVTMFRDDALARDMPADLYIGHVRVEGDQARIIHDEHSPINLGVGTYRVRRQRELEPKDARVVAD